MAEVDLVSRRRDDHQTRVWNCPMKRTGVDRTRRILILIAADSGYRSLDLRVLLTHLRQSVSESGHIACFGEVMARTQRKRCEDCQVGRRHGRGIKRLAQEMRH